MQSHEHEHEHHNLTDADGRDELTVFLEFTLKHNISHTGELSSLAEKLKGTGNTAAAEKVLSALEEYNKGNVLLKEALDTVE